MARPSGHVLVDANVARSARDPARHPTSTACWRLAKLMASRDCETGALMTPALRAEWREHASPTMVGWLASMESRSRIRAERDRPVRDLRNAVSAIEDDGIRAAIEKDLHLSEAAVLHGAPVASQDDKQRRFLTELASSYRLAGKVQWFNPVSDADWDAWIAEGCTDRSVYRCQA
jgi:hypothetical protein